MKFTRYFTGGAVAFALASFACGANATTVSWADLNSASSDGMSVGGAIETSTGSVGVQFSSDQPVAFNQIDNMGTNYWTGAGYTYNGSYNQPQTSDIVALNAANTETITFSKPVTDLYLALNSWNGASATLSHAFTIASEGCGYWGCGTFVPNADNTGFYGSGDAVGILVIPGTFSSLTITDTTSEYWHGLTVGIGSIAVSSAPEPSTWALMIVGVGGMGAALRSRSGRRKGSPATA